jgi:Glycosyl transferase family group 2
MAKSLHLSESTPSCVRKKAIQDTTFVDPADGVEKIWSKSNVSEGLNMALQLQIWGFVIWWVAYTHGRFKENVSLTVYDELNIEIGKIWCILTAFLISDIGVDWGLQRASF